VLQEDGNGGKVVVCKPKGSELDRIGPQRLASEGYVMKIRSKASLKTQCAEDQFRKTQERMLNFPPHDGVIPLSAVIENEDFFYVVMEKATGTDLFYSLLSEFKDGVMPEVAVKKLMRQILQAVSHVHRQGMLHRDIKPDNLVLHSYEDPSSPTGKNSKVMLIDFDHADPAYSPTSPQNPEKVDVIFGTIRFNAPETFLGEFAQTSDIYSVGVVLYMLMAGKMPYNDEIFDCASDSVPQSPTKLRHWKEDTYHRMLHTRVDWRCSPWLTQAGCRDFCMKLLAFNPVQRFASADEALAHSWLANIVSDDEQADATERGGEAK